MRVVFYEEKVQKLVEVPFLYLFSKPTFFFSFPGYSYLGLTPDPNKKKEGQ